MFFVFALANMFAYLTIGWVGNVVCICALLSSPPPTRPTLY
jgi:hypothetical protein